MKQQDTVTLPPARRANDYLINRKRFREPEMLFDEFWREGELALFFGAAGSGKSIFAVQLADALSRGGGGGLHGFCGPRGRRRVLYVDLRHTDEQFLMRCAYRADGGTRSRPHTFPKNLLRDRPAPGEDLSEWLRAYVIANQVQAVIIDDLSAVKNTHDGTRETLHLMRRLRAFRDELHISILVITDSREPVRNTAVSEADLGRSRVLCTAADSVFAVGRGRKRDGDHYFVQTRSRNARPFWEWQNAPVARLSRTATGLLCFEFNERFAPDMDARKRRLICKIARLHEGEQKTFREIARDLGISKSWAYELYRKWTPGMEIADRGLRNADLVMPNADEEPEEDDHWDEDEEWEDNADGEANDKSVPPALAGGFHPDPIATATSPAECETEDSEESDPQSAIPDPKSAADDSQSEIPDPKSIYDLALGHDGYGNEIRIESRCEHTGKPAVWYQLDKKGLKRRFTRGSLGIRVEHLGAGPFL